MKNKEIFPYVRNNYFKGKQLTVRDFRDEQDFFSDKLRAYRYNINGAGVVSGLDVVSVDSTTISVENGYAIDCLGRDIIIGTPIMKNINMLEGYDSVSDNEATYLCLEYQEELTEPTYAVCDSEEKNFNRISEGYRLFLTNKKPALLSTALMSLISTTKEVYSADNLSITMTAPKFARSGGTAEFSVKVEKRGMSHGLKVEFPITYEDFDNNGTNTSTVSYNNVTDSFDSVEYKFVTTVKENRIGMSTVKINAADISILIGDVPIEVKRDVIFDIELINGSIKERARTEYFRANIDSLFADECAEDIYLAEIKLTKSNRSAFIESVTPMPFGQYVMSGRLLYLLDRIPDDHTERRDEKQEIVHETAENIRNDAKSASGGTVTIDIPVDMKGKIYYSPEIVHGLGEGSVSYTVGFEAAGGSEDIVLFGNSDLFRGSRYDMEFPPVEYAVMSYNDKGTFRIAVKLNGKINAGSLKAHWNAVRTNDVAEKEMLEIERMSISIKPNLVKLEPRETAVLECVIEGCDNHNCIWNVEDNGGGVIDRNGVYKAPSTEGVYTVSATSVKYPSRKAVNYIIVSKKKEL